MRVPDGIALLALLATLGRVAPALAQVSASLSLQSDYRLRGVSLTDRNPALSLSASGDLSNGVYLGGSLIGQQTSEGLRDLGHMEYLGYAVRTADGAAWDVGVNNQDLTLYGGRPFRLKYSEVYVGVSKSDFSARLHYSPNWPGTQTLYLDLNGAWRPAPDWRVAGHVGVFKPLQPPAGAPPARYDARLDLIREFRRGEFSLGWSAATPALRPQTRRSHGGLVVGATAFF